ncbi:uncharacterized protein STEHIDRAFT_62817 [Stereum hirsutum FP-91666 SS1]|uniref:uncharacterized protein n=1 Tax=Stereum hirsutum (strain FP-91666) TaxID=721885 RepID=UPI000444A399|nr:uncharacterized protein STEHIDRAFT_62817 [Stereum hirsutum FP-91666 SS1]EIM83372.1 hypothetical protein STEHIDRAFT_62817 [Stereum hirsutum FP-91666 SS1]
MENHAKFPHCILLTRVGQFYESYFDQAVEVAELLNIKLASRLSGGGGQRAHMCGFPVHHLHKHLKVLVQHHHRFVALCEEFVRPPSTSVTPSTSAGAKLTFERRVTRVITPGTLIDEPFLNQYENNYLLAIGEVSASGGEDTNAVGLAWIDVSTGEFFTKDTTLDSLRDDLVRIAPREVVLSTSLQSNPSHPLRQAVLEEESFTSFIMPSKRSASSHEAQAIPEGGLTNTSKFSLSQQETAAVDLLTTFLHANLMESMPRLSSPSKEASEGRMRIDAHTIKALEIREGMREGGTSGSLLSVIKRTVTNSGTRLLARWLCSPSTSLAEVNARQSLVALFHLRPHLRDDLVDYLRKIDDATRIVQKFLLGRGDATDLSAISSTISTWTTIHNRMQLEKTYEEKERGIVKQEDWDSLDRLMSRMTDLKELADRIDVALKGSSAVRRDQTAIGESEDEAGTEPEGQLEPNMPEELMILLFPSYSNEIRSLHNKFQDLLTQREELERRFQQVYDASSLTLRSSSFYGLHVHIARSKRDAAPLKASQSFVLISESNSTSVFFNRAWSQLGTELMETSNSILAHEKAAFEALRNEVNVQEGALRRNAQIIDELDVTLGFANLAASMNFVRPTLTEDCTFHVVDGRHPTVELGLINAGRVFTPNTVSFSPESRLHIITGPNMAGKSTLLRQTALIAILAQTGSFVPAEHAVIGMVDALFSRVGAKDDLFRDKSTFMVEMLETAEILRRATPNSLVIMDEVGRGTTVKDGLAIAFATVHHLYAQNQCRALFATHFHEITDMLGYSGDQKGEGAFQNVGFYCTDVDEVEDGSFAYSHRLRPGVNRDSHGLKVAQLAGMPPAAIGVAKDALSWLRVRDAVTASSIADLKHLGQSLAKQSSASASTSPKSHTSS